ncbi:MAG: peptide ABC transporter ATP-binding protein, partial [Proteobacteria bacterium]|nr:peptide ABC transporter ATP-binding protein [Pseudomonadota bacterium]
TQTIPRGDVPSALNPPTGCHFHPRCAFATDKCRAEAPAPRETSPGYVVACHYAGELGEKK